MSSRGRAGGGGRQSTRPTLPSKLQKELGLQEAAGGSVNGQRKESLSHRERRRLEKQEKQQRRQAWAQGKGGKKKLHMAPPAASEGQTGIAGLSSLKVGRLVEQPKKSRVQKRKSRFEELLAPGAARLGSAAEADLENERRLAKKLKLKDGKSKDSGDGLDDLLDGLANFGRQSTAEKSSSEDESEGTESGSDAELLEHGSAEDADLEEDDQDHAKGIESASDDQGTESGSHALESEESESSHEEEKQLEERRKSKQASGSGRGGGEGAKYIPPHLREAQGKSQELLQVQRRVRGLLNRLSESNVESIAGDISGVFQAHARHTVSEVIREEILGALCEGPRGNDQYAATFAAFICGLAASLGEDIGANMLAALALRSEEMYSAHDELATRNLLLLFGHLYNFSLLHSDLVYQLLTHLCTRFQELDVASMVALLKTCGFALRSADPVGMKEFVMNIQERMAKAKAETEGGAAAWSKRVSFMLETICDIKNNKRRAKAEPVPYARLKKWLKGLAVDEVQLRSVTWQKLLEPEKKGQWWLPPPASAGGRDGVPYQGPVAVAVDASGAEAERLLALAASQRMNTDVRRAIFCIVMSSEDYVDAFEKLLRLSLAGQQEREVVRVIVDCCLQETAFNRYYALLLTRLCNHSHNHKFTLQYCSWDHFKQLPSLELRRIANLARLLAHVVASHALSLSFLKAVDFTDSSMTKKTIMHFRIFFETLLLDPSEETVKAVFSRLAGLGQLEPLRNGLAVFIHRHITTHQPVAGKTAKEQLQSTRTLLKRAQLALKALKGVEGSGHF